MFKQEVACPPPAKPPAVVKHETLSGSYDLVRRYITSREFNSLTLGMPQSPLVPTTAQTSAMLTSPSESCFP